MKKAKEVKYGIEITKPWSKEMYAHNEKVGEDIKTQILKKWNEAMEQAKLEYDENTCEIEAEENGYEIEPFLEREYTDVQTEELRNLQKDITCYGFGMGFSMEDVDEEVRDELENAASYRLKEMAEDMELELEQEFIGFN
tara:strand:+ start:2306 stop:2725 length:420 start_codon:yes stop_codon:yes gene_type:complete